jgi:ATP phosphoribosyltransferase
MEWIIVVPKNKGLKSIKINLDKILKEEKIKEYRVLEVRGEDVGFFVSNLLRLGKNAIGITGEDLFREWELDRLTKDLDIIRRYEWKDPNTLFGKPCLCLLGKESKNLESMPKKIKVAIADKYKKIAKHYLNSLEKKGYSFEKIYLSGSVEYAFEYGIADLIIDIVYSGKSAKNSGLKVYDRVFECDIVILGKRESYKTIPKIIIKK